MQLQAQYEDYCKPVFLTDAFQNYITKLLTKKPDVIFEEDEYHFKTLYQPSKKKLIIFSSRHFKLY